VLQQDIILVRVLNYGLTTSIALTWFSVDIGPAVFEIIFNVQLKQETGVPVPGQYWSDAGSIGPVLAQYWPSTGPVLAHTGMFTGLSSCANSQMFKREKMNLKMCDST